jgi:predicted nuclease of predicted toxin-antitoxin system
VKLLLDEMFDRTIAERLRSRGHDVVAVTESAELRGLSDEVLIELMTHERRVIVTENAAHFVPLLRARLNDGRPSTGVMITSPDSMTRNRRTIGLFVRVLERELRLRPTDSALDDQVIWISPR